MNLVYLVVTAELFMCAVLVECGDPIPDRTCATIYSQANFQGDSMKLKDFDQSADLRKEYRYSLDGWEKTGSISLEDGCKATICNKPYFSGTCLPITASEQDVNSLKLTNVTSANCTCTRTCGCNDVILPRDHKTNGFVGRAYLEGGCNQCDSEYLNLQIKKEVSENVSSSVRAFILPKGCHLKAYPEAAFQGEPITIQGPVYQDFKGTIVSYQHECTEEEPKDEPQVVDKKYPPKVDLPLLKQDVFEQTGANETLANHPGVQIVLESVRNSRSAKHAYVIFIGARVPYWLGFPQCKGKSSETIWECRMKARMPHIGLEGELRLIVVPVGYNTIPVHRKLLATVDQFMSSHEELKEVIPNAVILYHWISENAANIAAEGGVFHRKLSALHTLRNRLLDENYPNVMFLLDDLDSKELNIREQRQPVKRISLFETEITERWYFPNPVNFVIRSDIHAYTRFVNGYLRMENEEYWPRNLEVRLVNMCEKGEDPLGAEILKAVFNDRKAPHYYIEQIDHDISVNASVLNQFRDSWNISMSKMQLDRAMAQARWEAKKVETKLFSEIQGLKASINADKQGGGGGGCSCDGVETRIWDKLMKKLKPLLE